MRKNPRGQVSTQLAQIRQRLAGWHDVDVRCPLVTGIFLRIVAEATEEDRLARKSEITPYWRVVGEDGRLNPKFPSGMERQAGRLRAEGISSSTERLWSGNEPRRQDESPRGYHEGYNRYYNENWVRRPA